MSFYVTQFYFIEPTDDNYNPDLAGQVIVYGPAGDPPSIPPYSALIYVEEGFSYKPHPELQIKGSRQYELSEDDEGFLVVSIKEYVIDYKPFSEIEVPHCKYLIPSLDHSDAPIELYDRPFTMMPLEDSCINPALSGSPHDPAPCEYLSRFDLCSCSGYEELGTIQVGMIADVPVTVSRNVIGNTYAYGEETFKKYEDMLAWAEQNDLDYELTYLPDKKKGQDFYSGAMKRLAITYGE